MNCRSTDAMLFVSRVIKSTRTLRKIDLRSNPLGDLGSQMIANALKANRSLTHLNIRNTSLDLQGLKCLKNAITFSRLWTVDLSFNHIGADGAHLLAAALPKASMTALNVSNCFLTEKGAPPTATSLMHLSARLTTHHHS